MINDKHCFEMYGFDVIIDNNCKPWLLEINASPSLTTTNKADKQLKMELLNDLFTIVSPADWADLEVSKESIQEKNLKKVGNFNLLFDESGDNSRKTSIKGVKKNFWR